MLFAREDLGRVAGEMVEEIEFAGGESDGAALDLDGTLEAVDVDAIEIQAA